MKARKWKGRTYKVIFGLNKGSTYRVISEPYILNKIGFKGVLVAEIVDGVVNHDNEFSVACDELMCDIYYQEVKD